MKDPVLDRNLDECKELHTRWSQYHEFVKMAKKGEKITARAEQKFLELKTRIAMLHDAFLDALTHDHKTGQNVLNILGATILLRRIPTMSHAELQKVEFDWNEVYLLMTETVATLEEEQERLLGINETAYKLDKIKARILTGLHNFFVGALFKAAVILGIIGFVIFGVPAFGIYDYRDLYQYPAVRPFIHTAEKAIRTISSEYPYRKMDEVKEIELASVSQFAWNSDGIQNLTPAYFISQSIQIGFSSEDRRLVRDMIEDRNDPERPLDFFAERWRIAGRTGQADLLNAYHFLFKDSKTAREFVEMRRRHLDTLSEDDKKRYEAEYNFCRIRNFVAVFQSPNSDLRTVFPVDKWGFDRTQMNL